MFIIEKLVQDYHTRVENWTIARDKWVSGGGEYSYRNNREYEESHPRPGYGFKLAGRILLCLLAVGIAVTLIISLAVSDSHDSKHDVKKTTTSQKKTVAQTGVKVGDKVQVVYGDYKDSVGVVVKVGDDDAIIKLTNSTMTKAECKASTSCSEGAGTDNGQLLGIASLKNLVPYTEVK